MTPNGQEQITYLDPEAILADDNSRFGLKALQVDELMADIIETGGVHTPGEVEELEKPVGKKTHKLTVGHYRLASVLKANAEVKAGLLFPAIVRPVGDAVARLKRQLSENVRRESLSPMDQAVAITKLMGAGVPRVEIRRIFSRPGGRKGLSIQPASNAYLNMTMSFLDLPKPIQEKIHDGRVGVAAAYELTKVTPDKRAAVLERAESDRQAIIDREEKDEEKYLKAESRVAEVQAKATEAVSALDTAKAAVVTATSLVEEKKKEAEAAGTVPGFLTMPEAEKKKVTEKLAAAKNNLKAAEKTLKDATGAVTKLAGKVKTAAETAKEHAAKLAEARKVKGKAKGVKVQPKDVAKAAKAEGAESTTKVPKLNATEMRTALSDMKVVTYKIVTPIIETIERVFSGELTPAAGLRLLAELVKEPDRPRTQAPKAPK